MIKTFVCLLCTCTAVLSNAEEVVGLPRKPTLEKSELVFLTPQHVDFGEIACYGTLTRELRLRNNGAQDIKISRIVSTCGCIRGQVSTNLVAPNAELVVTATLDASQVHGTFKRVLWLNLADPNLKPINMTLSGTVIPIFTGFPNDRLEIPNLKPGATSTNTFTFVATERGVVLGDPQVSCSDQVSLDYTLTTNADELVTYTLTTRFTVNGLSASPLVSTISFPVIGTKQLVQPLSLSFKAVKGKALYVTPSYIGLDMKKKEAQMFRLVIKARREAMTHEKLTWDPLPDGIQIRTSTSGSRRAFVNAMITVKPEITAEMLKSGVPRKIVFHYPQYKDTEVIVGPADLAGEQGAAQQADSQRTPRRRLFVVDQEEPDPPHPPSAAPQE